jgi:hypothetical protein
MNRPVETWFFVCAIPRGKAAMPVAFYLPLITTRTVAIKIKPENVNWTTEGKEVKQQNAKHETQSMVIRGRCGDAFGVLRLCG